MNCDMKDIIINGESKLEIVFPKKPINQSSDKAAKQFSYLFGNLFFKSLATANQKENE